MRTLLTGPVASGKSRLAVRMAEATGAPVVLIATAEGLDEEMRERIARHRRERPASWTVVEEPLDLEGAIAAAGADAVLIVDCLTLWVSNLLGAGVEGDAVVARAAAAAAACVARGGADTIVVTNEVGWGIVPMNELARAYREVLGRVNRAFSAVADRALLVVAGRALPLEEVSP
jgi:adenosyl cobinamide kinase/adenosyl cobinamide phosphate guanylyltransferase